MGPRLFPGKPRGQGPILRSQPVLRRGVEPPFAGAEGDADAIPGDRQAGESPGSPQEVGCGQGLTCGDATREDYAILSRGRLRILKGGGEVFGGRKRAADGVFRPEGNGPVR